MTSTTYDTTDDDTTMERPKSIQVAVRLMIAGAVVSGLRALVPLIWGDQIRELALAGQNVSALSPQQVDSIVSASLGGAAVGALGGAALWLWMAWANNGGKGWARTVATVFFAISVLSFIYSITQPALPVGYALLAVSMVIGVAAIVALYRPSASAYIEEHSAK